MAKPCICNILGVEVGEKFSIDGFLDCTFSIKEDGTFKTKPSNVAGSAAALLTTLDHPDRVLIKPMSSLDHISWARIDEIGRAGNARKYFALGATKKDYMKNGFVAEYRIIGFDHDDLTSGGKAPVSWEMVRVYKDDRAMQDNGDSVPFDNSDMFGFLNGEFRSLMSDELSSVIKSVYKPCADRSGNIRNVTCHVWLLSEQEQFGRKIYSYGGEGHWYEFYKQENVDYFKTDESGTRRWHWERSPCYYPAYAFCYVGTSGSADYYSSLFSFGLAPAFCT